jgi:hypothetical protein
VAAALALVRLRAREVLYSEAVSFACEEAELLDPRPSELKDRRKPLPTDAHQPGWMDQQLRNLGESEGLPTVYLFWIVALLAFILADFVALIWTS